MNCQYCHSKIFEDDRVCDRCGAPNESFVVLKQKPVCFGEFIRNIENYAPRDLESHLLNKYIDKFIGEIN